MDTSKNNERLAYLLKNYKNELEGMTWENYVEACKEVKQNPKDFLHDGSLYPHGSTIGVSMYMLDITTILY